MIELYNNEIGSRRAIDLKFAITLLLTMKCPQVLMVPAFLRVTECSWRQKRSVESVVSIPDVGDGSVEHYVLVLAEVI